MRGSSSVNREIKLIDSFLNQCNYPNLSKISLHSIPLQIPQGITKTWGMRERLRIILSPLRPISKIDIKDNKG